MRGGDKYARNPAKQNNRGAGGNTLDCVDCAPPQLDFQTKGCRMGEISITNELELILHSSSSSVTNAGEYHFDNGDVYVGSWVDHRMEGKGKMVYSNGGGEYKGGRSLDHG